MAQLRSFELYIPDKDYHVCVFKFIRWLTIPAQLLPVDSSETGAAGATGLIENTGAQVYRGRRG
jgi:hypothetical protein